MVSRYHGGGVSVNITLGGSPVGSSVSIGTHDVIALIYDDELSKTCTGIYIVKGNECMDQQLAFYLFCILLKTEDILIL